MKDQYSDIKKRHQVIEVEANRIKAAKHIVVIGGGPVGIELMSEMCTKYPTKRLTMVCAENTFLGYMKNPNLHKRISTFFHDYGVILRMGERVIDVAETFGRYSITTSAEINNKLEADRVYFCAGFIPNTEFLRRNYPQILDEKNQIKVQDNLKVQGTTNMWALGDCNSTPEIKTAYITTLQSTYLIKNFSKMAKNKKVSPYEFASFPPPVFILSLGPFRGVFAAGSKILSTGALAVTAKDQILLIGVKQMNQEKSLLKIDYDKLLTKDLKSPVSKDLTEEDNEEEGNATLKRFEEEFGFH